MLIDGRFSVAAPPERLLAHLFDARLMAECLPGCESLQALADDRYRAVVVVSLAGIKARFDLQVEVTERRPDGIRALTRGEEGGNASSLTATSEVRLDAAVDGTQLAYTSDVSVTGRLGRFALGMMKKKAQAMGDEFAANLQRRLSSEAAAAAGTVGAADRSDAPPALAETGIDGSIAAATASEEAPGVVEPADPANSAASVGQPACLANAGGADARTQEPPRAPAAADAPQGESLASETAASPRP